MTQPIHYLRTEEHYRNAPEGLIISSPVELDWPKWLKESDGEWLSISLGVRVSSAYLASDGRRRRVLYCPRH